MPFDPPTRLVLRLPGLAPERSRRADRFGLHHATLAPDAVAAFSDATQAIAAHRTTIVADLDRALTADPHLAAGHATRGLLHVMLGRRETTAVARAALGEALDALDAKGEATAAEHALVEALARTVDGRFGAAAARLDRTAAEWDYPLLFVKLAHGLRFMIGDLCGMRRAGAAALRAYDPDRPGYGFVLGCHAFAVEESGDFALAERLGREALEHEREDAWGLHAVAHVYDMTGRARDGIDWIERTRPSWRGCNNFAGHLAWHLALFRLEQGDHAAVLELYDREVRPRPSEDFRDMANAVSLLWRLAQHHVALGDRWVELADIARRRAEDTSLIFASLHQLLALAAVGDIAGARAVAAAIAEAAETLAGEQGDAAALVGVPLARAVIAAITDRPMTADFPNLAARLPAIGGSNAQRDVFLRTLALIATAAGDRRAADAVIDLRGRLHSRDLFTALLAESPPS